MALFKNKKIIFGIIFLLIIVTSPWLWILIRNASSDLFKSVKPISFNSEAIKDEMNTYRGKMVYGGIPNFASRVIVNKVSFYSLEIVTRYLETFDPQYLFFTGDISITKSTRTEGPLYLSLLPLIVVGIYTCLIKRDKLILFLFLTSPIPASFVQMHYETLSRIPIFIMLSYFAAIGLIELFKRKKWLAVLIIFIFVFELSRFTHDFFIHYPQ